VSTKIESIQTFVHLAGELLGKKQYSSDLTHQLSQHKEKTLLPYYSPMTFPVHLFIEEQMTTLNDKILVSGFHT